MRVFNPLKACGDMDLIWLFSMNLVIKTKDKSKNAISAKTGSDKMTDALCKSFRDTLFKKCASDGGGCTFLHRSVS